MLCQSCGKRTATTHIKTIIGGELSECALCTQCAASLGYADLLSDWGFGSLLGGMLGGRIAAEKTSDLRCPFCGCSFDDIAASGTVGCAQCYETFRDRLLPSIQKLHGNSTHRGKMPGSSTLAIKPETSITLSKSELEEKKEKLQEAIKEQNFELAAVLRDEIRMLEGTK